MTDGNGRISMESIAERLGVSAMTVSRALGSKNPPLRKDAAELFQRIHRAATELGYRKSSAPRSMITGRYDSICILGSDHWRRNHMPTVRLLGMQDAADRYGVSLLFNRIADFRLQDPSFIPDMLSDWRSDGMLINYTSGYPERLEELLTRYRAPAVWMNSKHEADCIHPDDFGGARLATEHLVSLGHRRIAMWNHGCTVVSSYHYSVIDRFDGYRTVMLEAGLEPVEMLSPEPITYKDYHGFVTSYLEGAERPTAILTYGVSQAVAVQTAAARLNLRIPEDLSLICFHDEKDIFQFTTIFIPELDLGSRAVDLIMKKIEKPEERVAPVAIPMELYLPEITCASPSVKTVRSRKQLKLS